ncbi:hypothetical protein EX30DRAFT_254951 [Ascodesmis nigricans]|uniref:Uncharacterized protein n=1 Tax=Ascodesmis nigricans TaxID=341454 RepID=A0A4S2MYF3_9PEZI|nr:hypothetical protein EX30DRAFT_254951 [Ascodesmis nigricans]
MSSPQHLRRATTRVFGVSRRDFPWHYIAQQVLVVGLIWVVFLLVLKLLCPRLTILNGFHGGFILLVTFPVVIYWPHLCGFFSQAEGPSPSSFRPATISSSKRRSSTPPQHFPSPPTYSRLTFQLPSLPTTTVPLTTRMPFNQLFLFSRPSSSLLSIIIPIFAVTQQPTPSLQTRTEMPPTPAVQKVNNYR